MKWTYDWLKDYLQTELPAEKIAEILTRTGLEVEDLITPIAPIAAKIVECKPHENSDHLHVLMVDDGTATLRQVVCGAPNARVGLVSALATPGCVIAGHVIQSGKLRGVLSDGMMCSGKELGINDDHSGIIELDADTKLGSAVVDVKTVFDAGITPNRPDYLSVRGIARDLAACGAGKYTPFTDKEPNPVESTRAVHIKTDKCPVYQFCEIHDIKMNDSHEIVKSRLAAIGINPKNAPIDATNYVCYDIGQPMHCFDADEIVGDITVRMAAAGEGFTDLFGNTHKLTDSDMVIADDAGILALAGVIGGARASTTDKTKNIILESAYFDPVSVRKSAKRIGVSTDASYRYERGIDPTITGEALYIVARMIMTRCGGTIVGTGIAGAVPSGVREIEYDTALFRQKTGIDMPVAQQLKIFQDLGFEIKKDREDLVWTEIFDSCDDADTSKITPDIVVTVIPRPSRVNIEIPENLIAELIRIYGYDKIAENAAHTASDAAPHNDCNLQLKSALAARGLNECDSYGFGNSDTESLLSDKPIVKIANPITSDMNTMRNGLLENVLQFVHDNEKRGYSDLNLFMVGTVFDGDAPGQQHTQMCVVRTGATSPKHWQGRARDVDIYDVKADIVSLLNGQKYTVDSANPPAWAHPYRYGKIMQGKKCIAEFGELHPMVAKKLRIKTNTVIAIVDNIENLTARKIKHVGEFSEFQPITRDFAFIVANDTPAAKLTAAAAASDARITDVVVFDAFDMGDGQKSIAFTITIIPTENMTDADLLKIQDAVIANVEKKCNAKIRDK